MSPPEKSAHRLEVPPEFVASRMAEQLPHTHPRLLYTRPRLEQIRDTLQTTRRQGWGRLLRDAERARERSVVPVYPSYRSIEDRKARQIAYKRYYMELRQDVDAGLQPLALAYLVTQSRRYLEPAKAIALELAQWPTNKEDITSVFPRWGWDEVGLSIARCLHRAYDWLYDGLSDDERARLSRACIARATQVYLRLQQVDFLANPQCSHCNRLITYLGEMGLVLGQETREATEWFVYSVRAMTTVYPYWATDDGGWSEGLWYAHDYLELAAPLLVALSGERCVDLWRRPVFKNLPDFIFYCVALHGEMLPFGDGAELDRSCSASTHFGRLMTLWSHIYEDPKLTWWTSMANARDESSWELELYFEDLPPRDPLPSLPDAIPGARRFSGVGWAAIHGNLCDPRRDTVLLFKSSPFGSVSHSHADQNTFAISKGGRALAIPSGYYGPAYGLPHHSEWTQSTKANNCILVDGRGQSRQDPAAVGQIIAFHDSSTMTYVAGDATSAYAGALLRCHRHILMIRPGVILMLDELEAPRPAHFTWLLHSLGEMRLREDGAVVQRGDARLDVTLLCTEGLELHQDDRFDPPYDAGLPPGLVPNKPAQWHLSATTLAPARRVRIAAVMSVSDEYERLPLQLGRADAWATVHTHHGARSILGGVRWHPTQEGDASLLFGEVEGRRSWFPSP
ncbi:MAG: heparinase II/III family protein [Myxococcota bacterium]